MIIATSKLDQEAELTGDSVKYDIAMESHENIYCQRLMKYFFLVQSNL